MCSGPGGLNPGFLDSSADPGGLWEAAGLEPEGAGPRNLGLS